MYIHIHIYINIYIHVLNVGSSHIYNTKIRSHTTVSTVFLSLVFWKMGGGLNESQSNDSLARNGELECYYVRGDQMLLC